jgi:fumarylacetoacetate (FAA) hydrolase family protein
MQRAEFEESQVIGVAYTFETSQNARRTLTCHDAAHSAWTDSFSYFRKGQVSEAVPDGGALRLRPAAPYGSVPHWPEPELAVLLGREHVITGYALANDLTAFTVEAAATSGVDDPTHAGKCWPGSCGLGPAFISAREMGSVDDLVIEMRIERGLGVIFHGSYSTSSRRLDFSEIPGLIAARRRRLGENPRRSKRVKLDATGCLPPGTVVLLGTGLIVPPVAYCRPGDRVTISCPGIGELSHELRG